MSGHTPGPWVVKIEAYPMADSGDYDSCFAVYSSSPKHPIVQIWEEGEEPEANARLIAAAPDLLEAQTMGNEVNTPDFLDWMADRLVHVYGEPECIDFVLSLRLRAKAARAAIAKATGETT